LARHAFHQTASAIDGHADLAEVGHCLDSRLSLSATISGAFRICPHIDTPTTYCRHRLTYMVHVGPLESDRINPDAGLGCSRKLNTICRSGGSYGHLTVSAAIP
jgi:hypothetical protein